MLTGKQFRNVFKCVVKGAWMRRRGWVKRKQENYKLQRFHLVNEKKGVFRPSTVSFQAPPFLSLLCVWLLKISYQTFIYHLTFPLPSKTFTPFLNSFNLRKISPHALST